MTPSQPPHLRKMIHLLTGLLILLLSYYLDRMMLLYLIMLGAAFAVISFNLKPFMLLHHSFSKSLGTLFYPAGVLSSYLLLYAQPIYYFQASLMVLTVSDTLANLAGQFKPGNKTFMVFKEHKSLYGVLGYSISALVILYIFVPHTLYADWWFMLLALLLAVNFEVISVRGSDNFSITFGLSLFFLINETHSLDMPFLFLSLIMMAAGAWLLYHWRMLSRPGSLAAYLLGVFLLAVMGWEWMLPVLAFFITSLIFTKVNKHINKKAAAITTRNAWQVTANILWAVGSAILYLITGSPWFELLFIVFVASVTADTWASEIGPVFNKRSFSLRDGRFYAAGTTGAISVSGSLAALAGAFTIAVLAAFLFYDEINWRVVSAIALAAFLSTFIDSLLGAFWETKLLERPYFKTSHPSERITPNDLVNLAGSLSAGVFFLAIAFVFDLL
jgi:uncharacterized protein (TIGR00297 family)